MMEKRTVFISGAASGIGLATAKMYAQKGYFVGLVDIDDGKLQSAHEEVGVEQSAFYLGDITSEESIGAAMAGFMERTGNRLDVLLANAGVVYAGNYEDKTLEAYKKIIEINTFGVLVQINAALPYLKKTANSAIIVTSSASSVTGIPFFSVYSGTKHFTTGLVEALNIEFEKYGIFVGDVLPSFVMTGMAVSAQQGGLDLKKLNLLTPEDIAAAIVKHEAERKKIHVVVGEFKKLAMAKRLTTQQKMRSIVKKEIYDNLKNMYEK